MTRCSSIPSHTKPLLPSWILSSTLMTIQYSLQAADERPIHGSICCGPNSPDASLVRGLLRANWKTEAISQRQCLCARPGACVCALGLDRTSCEREREKEKMERKSNNKRWRDWRKGGGGGERRTFRSSHREQLTCQHLFPCGHIGKAPVGFELTQPKATSCN